MAQTKTKAKTATGKNRKRAETKGNVTAIKSGYLVETWPLHEIKPYEKNARKIPEAAVLKVAKSLQEFGWRQPMVVDTNGVLIVGHARRLAAVHLGWTEGPVHVAKDLTPEQIRAYRLMDNRSHQETEWSIPTLQEEIFELEGLDLDLTLTGFNEAELARFLNGEGETDPNAEWQGMPEFDMQDARAFRSINVNFANQSSVDEFARLLGQRITDKTKSIWHPMKSARDLQSEGYVGE